MKEKIGIKRRKKEIEEVEINNTKSVFPLFMLSNYKKSFYIQIVSVLIQIFE